LGRGDETSALAWAGDADGSLGKSREFQRCLVVIERILGASIPKRTQYRLCVL
jgi:hypothetical protein